MDEFAWSKEQAVLYNNIFYAGLAVIAILSFVFVKIITKWSVSVTYFRCTGKYLSFWTCRVSERVMLMVAMFIVALGFFTLIPMGNDYPSVQPAGKVYC